MEAVIKLLNDIRQMSPQLERYLRSVLVKKYFKKGDIILQIGEVSNFIGYVEVGVIVGSEWKKNMEVTTWIMKEGDIFFSPKSFLTRCPSEEAIIAIEDCIVWGIAYEELEHAYEHFQEFNYHGRIITGIYYIRSLELLTFLTRHTAEEKYAMLMEKDPELCERVPNIYLASYLDMNAGTLSLKRSEYSKAGRVK